VQGSEVQGSFWVLGSGFSVLGARCWIRWRILPIRVRQRSPARVEPEIAEFEPARRCCPRRSYLLRKVQMHLSTTGPRLGDHHAKEDAMIRKSLHCVVRVDRVLPWRRQRAVSRQDDRSRHDYDHAGKERTIEEHRALFASAGVGNRLCPSVLTHTKSHQRSFRSATSATSMRVDVCP
jgi:hypothetical protein